MYKNEILDEIHRYREEYARSFQYDLRAIFNDLQQKQLAHKDRLVRLPIKRWSNKSGASDRRLKHSLKTQNL